MKLLVLFTCLISAVFGAHDGRDLAADISTAERSVNYFNVEVNSLAGRLFDLQSELNFDVFNTCENIINDLTNLTVSNLDEIVGLMQTANNQSNQAIDAKEFNLEQTRLLLVVINGNLQSDLAALNVSTSGLQTYISIGDAIYNSLFTNLQTAVDEIDVAINTATSGLEGVLVTRVLVNWTHAKDVLVNQKFLTENVKLVYDARGKTALEDLNVVVAQV